MEYVSWWDVIDCLLDGGCLADEAAKAHSSSWCLLGSVTCRTDDARDPTSCRWTEYKNHRLSYSVSTFCDGHSPGRMEPGSGSVLVGLGPCPSWDRISGSCGSGSWVGNTMFPLYPCLEIEKSLWDNDNHWPQQWRGHLKWPMRHLWVNVDQEEPLRPSSELPCDEDSPGDRWRPWAWGGAIAKDSACVLHARYTGG